MSTLKFIGFVGESPKIIPRLLPDMAAQIAHNTRLDDGGLTPVRQMHAEYQFPSVPAGGYKTIYKWGTTWMGWPGDVYAVPGPVADDRLYIMGDGPPKMIVGGATYPLAVPFPPTALTASLSGTATPGAQGTTRIYVYTYVTAFGEESEPCPPSADVFWTPGQTVTLSGFLVPPAGRNITLQRIYRAQTGKTGTSLYFIAERPASANNFVDNVSPESLQEVIPSVGWTAPPADLTGLISLPNGMMAAFHGKELCFSEPWRPHAWPDAYKLTMDYPIVGLGAFGSSVVVTTKGTPYIVTGTEPESMASERIEENLPCINARGIVDLGYMVVYPSGDGLVQVTSAGARIFSTSLFSRDDWLRLNPANMAASHYNGRYFTTYGYSDLANNEYIGAFIIDMTGEQPYLLRTNSRGDALYYDLPSGQLYMLVGAVVYEWDSLQMPNAIQQWKSKLVVMPKPTNFGAILVEADTGMTPEEEAKLEALIAQIQAYNNALFDDPSIGGEVDGSALNAYPLGGDALLPLPTSGQTVSVNVYAGRTLVATVGVVNKMARLPSGFLDQLWEVEVVGNLAITQVTLATTGAELAGV
jgi:hypothetical protein